MLKAYLEEHVDLLKQLVNDIYSYNGALSHLVVYENDEEFFDLFFHDKPMEALRAAHFGYYDYNDEYVKFDVYENLVSFDEVDYQDMLVTHIDEILKELDECNEKEHIIDDILFQMRQQD